MKILFDFRFHKMPQKKAFLPHFSYSIHSPKNPYRCPNPNSETLSEATNWSIKYQQQMSGHYYSFTLMNGQYPDGI